MTAMHLVHPKDYLNKVHRVL